MSLRLGIGIAAIVAFAACGVISTIVHGKMLDQVNDALAQNLQFSSFGWYFSKTQSLHREYRRLLPAGPLLWQGRILLAIMLSSLLVCAWALGFFG
jgi:hypothetical protein